MTTVAFCLSRWKFFFIMSTLVTRLLVTYPGNDCTQPLLDHNLMTIYSLSQKPVVRASVVSSPQLAGAQEEAPIMAALPVP